MTTRGLNRTLAKSTKQLLWVEWRVDFVVRDHASRRKRLASAGHDFACIVRRFAANIGLESTPPEPKAASSNLALPTTNGNKHLQRKSGRCFFHAVMPVCRFHGRKKLSLPSLLQGAVSWRRPLPFPVAGWSCRCKGEGAATPPPWPIALTPCIPPCPVRGKVPVDPGGKGRVSPPWGSLWLPRPVVPGRNGEGGGQGWHGLPAKAPHPVGRAASGRRLSRRRGATPPPRRTV